jgi:transcriptional activator SPT8
MVTLSSCVAPTPALRHRSPSPAARRRTAILEAVVHPRSYTVEAIGAIPHPEPTHALAASLCLTHFITGSDDGYVRDYDLFSAANGKIFLTGQQRAHCGVIEGTMKAVPIRCWWENPACAPPGTPLDEVGLSPIYSLAMQSDALWTLAGSDVSELHASARCPELTNI